MIVNDLSSSATLQNMVFITSFNFFKNVLWLQWIASLGATVMNLTIGLMMGWSSPYLAQLTAEDSPLPITKDEASWVVSLMNLGRFVGAFTGGICVKYFGSKQTLIFIGFPLILSWICIILADSVIWLYVARIACGLSLGMSFSSFPLYLGEVSSPTLRGSMVSLAMTGFASGIAVGSVMGPYMSMAIYSYISLVPNVAFILLFLWIPPSPHYLIFRGRIEDAEKAIARYNPYVDSRVEVETLKNFMARSESPTLKVQLREFRIPHNIKAIMITLALYFFMQFSGLNSVVFYMEIIFTDAKVTFIPPATGVMIVTMIGVVAGWISIYIADKFRRKILMIVSSAGVCVAMIALGTHFHLLENGFDSNALQWLPITSVIVFQIFIGLGIITVPSMILSELFAPNIKNLAASIASISIGVFSFAAAKSYQPMVDAIGEDYVFFIHAVIMALSVIFAAIYLPETKGKSLQEIQDALVGK